MAKQVEFFDKPPADFRTEYVAKRRAFAVRGAASHWPAVGKWNPQYLKKMVGHHRVSQVSLDYEELHEFSFAEYLDLLEQPSDEVGDLPYIRNKFLHDVFPELSPDVGKVPWLDHSWIEREPLASLIRVFRPNWFNWAEFFICQPHVRFPTAHTDHAMIHAWSAQIYGRKRYWVWPVIPGFKDTYCIGEDLETLLGVEPFTIDIGPGDVVVIPSGMPHVAESLTTSITVSASYVDESNWEGFSREFCALDLLPVLRDGGADVPDVGKALEDVN